MPCVAARPDAKAIPWVPPSSVAIACSSAPRVGFPRSPVLEAATQPTDAVLLERGAHLDGGHHGAGLRIWLGAGVDRERLESVGHRRTFLHGRAADLPLVA